jgi:hypothetical protein
MGSTADIELAWGDGTHLFSLRIGQIGELQEKCGDPNRLDGSVRLAGPGEIASRLLLGTWRLADVRETIRLALIGGGKSPTEAHMLCTRYIDQRPLNESVLVAQAIILRALNGPPEEEAASEKKDEAAPAAGNGEATTREVSPLPAFTAGVAH